MAKQRRVAGGPRRTLEGRRGLLPATSRLSILRLIQSHNAPAPPELGGACYSARGLMGDVVRLGKPRPTIAWTAGGLPPRNANLSQSAISGLSYGGPENVVFSQTFPGPQPLQTQTTYSRMLCAAALARKARRSGPAPRACFRLSVAAACCCGG